MDSITLKEPSTLCAPPRPPVVISDDSSVMCSKCSTKFASIKLLNRHKQRIHKITVSTSRKTHIICPLCEERRELKTHAVLRKHLDDEHAVNIELFTLQFPSVQEYETWKNEENIDTGYAMHRTCRSKDHKEVNYICNRSDYRGYQPNYQRRREKSGGTIRIQGMCPSKLICKLYDSGVVSITFWMTHVGHEIELRSLHLSKAEQDIVVKKMKSGVPINTILEDARNLKGPELKRINLINRDNIVYLTRKHNIDKKRDSNEMVTADLQDEEEMVQFIEENSIQEILKKSEDRYKREVKWTNFKNWAESLNDEVFDRFMNNIQGAIRKVDKATQGNKRKMETREYFPAKRH